ncbi:MULTISPECIES: hypothetical protein [Hymenobacter]|uniref:Uncharacterized protein n=1 Tax=Hymenobacter jejuensis TaxID=2502781 RepID=A0A5B8A346_9BACT|nr:MULTISPECIES: hypothetical protein [Hymenobacter]MBC6990572.1 hypothetical protein [Hymenobacter sp. BT491]QDA61013.1 hypothetical protein FHG12_13260 [Hymenobacter jejuensis]
MPPTSTRIRLQPANTSRIPFWGQLIIGGLWIAYTVFSLWAHDDADDSMRQSFYFLNYAFLIFSFVYVGYVLVHNAPIFGTQSYLEFTPGYIVHKNGLFRAKQVFAAEDMESLDMVAQQLRVRLKDGNVYALSLRQVKGTKRKARLRDQIHSFATTYNIPLRDSLPKK